MDDFNLNSLNESRNEWSARLLNLLTPHIFDGFKLMLDEANKLSTTQNQPEKYLMTYQNLLIQIPKWNNETINNEVTRIVNASNCSYIEDLITCVHIIQLKALTCVRVGQNEKNVTINIPKLSDFIHKTYINCARSIYSNIYLFEQEIKPLQIQQNYNKVHLLIKECIIDSIRESMPIDEILKSYLEDTGEHNITTNDNQSIDVSLNSTQNYLSNNDFSQSLPLDADTSSNELLNDLKDSTSHDDIIVSPGNVFSSSPVDANVSEHLISENELADSLSNERNVTFSNIEDEIGNEIDNLHLTNSSNNIDLDIQDITNNSSPQPLAESNDDVLGVEYL